MRDCRGIVAVALLLAAVSARAEEPLRFTASDDGTFRFDTARVAGTLRGDGYGVVSVVDKASGVELAYGGSHQGLLGYYRVFAGPQRFTDSWHRPATARLLPDGAVQVDWPADAEQPYDLSAVYRLAADDTLDVVTTVTARAELPAFEVFMGSYFAAEMPASVYLAPPRHQAAEGAALKPADVGPLTDGTYLMFPRDREAARFSLDGRWDVGKNPVQWSITRYLAAPLALRRHPESGTTGALMAEPGQCFAMSMAYNKTPPDRIAKHSSIYFSLFGRDLAAGEKATARCRLVVGPLDDAEVLARYRAFAPASPKPAGP